MKIGSPNDKYEKEADDTAEMIMRKPWEGTDSTSFEGASRDSISKKEFLSTKSNPVSTENDRNDAVAKKEFLQAVLYDESDQESQFERASSDSISRKEFLSTKSDPVSTENDRNDAVAKKEFLQAVLYDESNEESQSQLADSEKQEHIQTTLHDEEHSSSNGSVRRKEEDSLIYQKTYSESALDLSEVNRKEESSSGDMVQTALYDESQVDKDSEVAKLPKSGHVQRELDEDVQTKDGKGSQNDLSEKLQTSKGGGAPLPKETNQEMGERFGGRDFSNVRVHTDARSVQMNKDLNSKAFANGKDVYFNSGQFDTNSDDGKKLLAHELTHTIQQGESGDKIQRKLEDPFKSEDGDVPAKNMEDKRKEELGDDAGKPLSADEKAEGKPDDTKDQKKENQAEIDEEGDAKPQVDREKENAPRIQENVKEADKQVEEEPDKEEPQQEEIIPEEEAELTESQKAALKAESALQEEAKIKDPKPEKEVKPVKLEPAVDADGQAVPVNPSIAKVPLIAAQIQAHRDQAQEIEEKATEEERYAEGLRAGIYEIYSKIYDSNDYLDVILDHTEERKELLDKTDEQVKVNEERTTTVAQDAPDHIEGTRDIEDTIGSSVEESKNQESDSNSLNDPEMEEESKDSEEGNEEVQDALEESPEQSKALAETPLNLIEEAEIAKTKNEEIKNQISINRETVAKTEEDLLAKKKHNADEKAKLDTTVNEPDRIKKEAKTIQKEARKMKKKSKKDERQLHKTYDDYLSKMSNVPGLAKIEGEQDNKQNESTPDAFIQRQEEDSGPIPGYLTPEEKQLYRENREALMAKVDNEFDRKLIDEQMEMEANFKKGDYWGNVGYGLNWSRLQIASMVSKINWIDAAGSMALMILSPYHLTKATVEIVEHLLFPEVPENDPFLTTLLRMITSAFSIVAAIYGMMLGYAVFGFIASSALALIPWFTIPMGVWATFFQTQMVLYGGLFAWYVAASAILHAGVYLLDLERAGVQDSAEGLQAQSNQLTNDIDQASFSVTSLLFLKGLGLGARFTRWLGSKGQKGGKGNKGGKNQKGGANEEVIQEETTVEENVVKEEKPKVETEEVLEENVTNESETILEEGKVEPEQIIEEEVNNENKREEGSYETELALNKAKTQTELEAVKKKSAELEQRFKDIENADAEYKEATTGRKELLETKGELEAIENDLAEATSNRQVTKINERLEKLKSEIEAIESKAIGEHGLRKSIEADFASIEKIKYDPLGDVNSKSGKNHYDAARKEAKGEPITNAEGEIVVKDTETGKPYSHIRDLQSNGYDALVNILERLMKEKDNRLPGRTSQGDLILDAKIREVNKLINRVQGFLNEIGWPPSRPHKWVLKDGKWVGVGDMEGIRPNVKSQIELVQERVGNTRSSITKAKNVERMRELFTEKTRLEQSLNDLKLELEGTTSEVQVGEILNELSKIEAEIANLEFEAFDAQL